MKKIAIVGLFSLLCFVARAAVITVPTDQATIADAIAAAGFSGDEIYVLAGDYTISATLMFDVGKNLTLRGDGPGVTNLIGDGLTQIIYAGFFESLVIEDLTIDNGFGSLGGGISADGLSAVTLTDVVISNCNATDGGGLYATSSDITMLRTYFVSNAATGNGGGMCYDNSWGAAGTVCNIDKTSFNANSATGNGAAFCYDSGSDAGSFTMSNSTIGNHVTGSSAIELGGSSASTVLHKNNTIANNPIGGFHITNTLLGLTQYNNIIVDNTAYDISASAAISIGGDRNLLEVASAVTYIGDNYYEPFASAVVSTTFAYNNGGTVPTLDLTDFGIRVAAGRARNQFPADGLDQNGLVRRDRSDLGAMETTSLVNVWIAETSTDYNLGTNWTDGAKPTASTTYVIIDNCDNTNYPINTVFINIPALKIVIGNFGAFRSNVGIRVSKIYLMSNGSGTGQFSIGSSFIGSLEVEQYLFGGQWNFLGVPVGSIAASSIIPGAGLATSTPAGSSYTYNDDGEYWIFEHNEVERATNGATDLEWEPVNGGNLTGGPGYIVYSDVPQKAVFTGGSVGPNINHSLSFSSGLPEDQGWNLISNPYLSPFTWVGADITNIDQAAYYFNNAFQNYFVIPGIPIDGSTEKVPQVQAFFVKSNLNAASFTMPSSNLGIDLSVKFKASSMDTKHYLKATFFRDSEKFYDETYIQHIDDATLSFEGKYDAYKLKSFSDAVPQIYTTSMGTDMTINRLSYYDYPNQEIPLTLKVPTLDAFKIAFAVDESMGDFAYKLEDKSVGMFYDLSDMDTLQINMTQLVENDRFVVHIYSLATPIDVDKVERVLMYSSEGKVYLKTPVELSQGTMRMYDMTGRLVKQEAVGSTRSIIDASSFKDQFVVVTYECNKETFKQKMNIR